MSSIEPQTSSKPPELRQCLGFFLRGMAMGIADLVPGVSGGTIAFITGIYERFIRALGSLTSGGFKHLLRGQLKAFWRSVDATFLLCVFSGIITSILLFAKVIVWILEHHPRMLWAYFFGLILASAVHFARQIELSRWANWLLMLLGTLSAFLITQVTAVSVTPSPGLVFVAGAIAICAMILPGISGSFILVLMGVYEYVVRAVKELDLAVISLFALGCISGLLAFSHFLSWLLKRYHDLTLATLIGFMLGSLNKLWPWQHQSLVQGQLTEIRLLPQNYQVITGIEPQVLTVLLLVLSGMATLLLLNRLNHGGPSG